MAIKRWFGVAALMATVAGAGAAVLAKSKEAREKAGATHTSAMDSTANAVTRMTGGTPKPAANSPEEESPPAWAEPVQEK